ncbi:MAG: methyl-accepting chemotaxis protein [Ruminiclostridium sp.]
MYKINSQLTEAKFKKNVFYGICLKIRNSILGKISISFVSIIAVSLLLVGIFTYQNVKKSDKNRFILSEMQILEQNQNYVDFLVTTVENNSNQLFADADIREKITSPYSKKSEKYKAASDINEKLRSITLTNSLIDSIYILNPKHISVREPHLQAFDIDIKDETELYKKAVKQPGMHLWIPPHNDEFSTDTKSMIISDIRFSSELGVMAINISPKAIQDALSKVTVGNEGFMYIIDKEGNIISHPDSSLLGSNMKDSEVAKNILLTKAQSGSFTYKDKEKKMFAVYTTSKKTNWNFVTIIPFKELTLSAESIRNTIIFISTMCLLLAIIISIAISRYIIKPIKKINIAMDKVGNGYLTGELGSKSKDELGELSNNFDKMVKKLKSLVSTVKKAVEETNSTSNIIEKTSEQFAMSVEEVSGVIEEIASGAGWQAAQAAKGVEIANGFGEKVELVVAYSREVYAAAMEATNKADIGSNTIEALKGRSKDGILIIDKVSESISEMSKNSMEIEEILKTITRISKQTNLLSLNATIEAARAGESGQGFAIVANEVGKLADESQKAADNINIILKNVNARTKDSVETTKTIVVILEEQGKYIDNTLNIFDSIKGSTHIVGEKMNKLNDVLDNINSEKSEILKAIEVISDISQETAASTQEISASAEEEVAVVQEMSSMANELAIVSTKLKEITDGFIID